MLEVFKESNLNKDSLDAERKRVLESIDAHFVLHSPYMLNLFKKSTNVPKTNVTQINFSIDTNVFKPLPCTSKLRKKYSIPEDDVVLLFRAQEEFKGLSYIITALKSIPNHHNISLITVGGEGFVDELKSEYNVHDFGLIDDENEMTKIYNLCDIFLAPSTEESFGFMAQENETAKEAQETAAAEKKLKLWLAANQSSSLRALLFQTLFMPRISVSPPNVIAKVSQMPSLN